ncbi:amidohydrolase family protein [Planomicrobium sp. YIM 101495]|uniref:amidohydrolase family protein n=1 Tax=Planomicrobium sp. YIM 101495 TaxID=2665160 RepID=UPI0012B86C38|nr:amidohydrolase family protein [Planomicrobium sp. YIM 101495]MTD30647.1 amidohydrolase family protein [Planomicrobium sp. YIM 101495]
MTNHWISNVLIEKGFKKVDGRIVGTETETVHLEIEDGKIKSVSSHIPAQAAVQYDAANLLLLPSLREMHIHIDKTYYGGPWKACTPITKGIFTRLEEEKELLPKLLPTAQDRAEKMIDLLINNGHTHIRTHCNVDPVIGLKNLEATVRALEKYKGRITYDIVAFPQHGLLRSDSVQLVRDAMRNGATLVGGVDPATVDRHIERSLTTVFDIAAESNKGIDLHLHDVDTLGAYTFSRLAQYTEEAKMQGNVTISHGMALGDFSGDALDEILAELRANRIDVTTTIPVNRPTIPVLEMDKAGIGISLGHDSITDHWSPFGTGNTIQKLNILAERFKCVDEFSLNRILKYATGGITPLDNEGERVWPKVGDDASMILVNATCTSEAIARRAGVKAVFFNGQEIKNRLPQMQ